MAGDLGTLSPEVHEEARHVLAFWFDGLMPEQHFATSASVDEAVGALFGPLRGRLLATGAAGWRDDPETLVAAVIVLDQFSRNLFRGKAEAFAADPLARELTVSAIDRGWDRDMNPDWRHFLYMPLMHAEDAALQRLSVEKFADLGNEESLAFARDHAEAIRRFGRFPGRNAALGRVSTRDELDWLSRPGAGW
ncbi:MAG: DUF924 family protein [Pseudomonadota bacterium]